MYDWFRLILDAHLKHKWNTMWKRSYVVYNARGMGAIDIRTVFDDTSEKDMQELKEAAESFEYQRYYDDRMADILNFTHFWIKYKGDRITWGKPEYWQDAYTTWKLKTGDCEDGAILMYKLAVLSGVPEWRLKLCAGWVQNPRDRRKKVGHAYLIYLSEQYNEWFVLDWTYWYKECINAYLKIPHRYMQKYGEIWWTTNHKYSWAQHDTLV